LPSDDEKIIIRVDTSDNTSKVNFDDLLGLDHDLKHILKKLKVHEIWADHNTQIITFEVNHEGTPDG
jgi:hypothetical protein